MSPFECPASSLPKSFVSFIWPLCRLPLICKPFSSHIRDVLFTATSDSSHSWLLGN